MDIRHFFVQKNDLGRNSDVVMESDTTLGKEEAEDDSEQAKKKREKPIKKRKLSPNKSVEGRSQINGKKMNSSGKKLRFTLESDDDDDKLMEEISFKKVGAKKQTEKPTSAQKAKCGSRKVVEKRMKETEEGDKKEEGKEKMETNSVVEIHDLEGEEEEEEEEEEENGEEEWGEQEEEEDEEDFAIWERVRKRKSQAPLNTELEFYKRLFGPDKKPSQFREEVVEKAEIFKRQQQGPEKNLGLHGIVGYQKRKKGKKKKTVGTDGVEEDDGLDVVSEPREMFEDLVSSLFDHEFSSLAQISPLRVATMCSVRFFFSPSSLFLPFLTKTPNREQNHPF